jgi:hypothetical protein
VVSFRREAPNTLLYVVTTKPGPLQLGYASTYILVVGFTHLFNMLSTNFCMTYDGRPPFVSTSKHSIHAATDIGWVGGARSDWMWDMRWDNRWDTRRWDRGWDRRRDRRWDRKWDRMWDGKWDGKWDRRGQVKTNFNGRMGVGVGGWMAGWIGGGILGGMGSGIGWGM